jgi:hypothetical protein
MAPIALGENAELAIFDEGFAAILNLLELLVAIAGPGRKAAGKQSGLGRIGFERGDNDGVNGSADSAEALDKEPGSASTQSRAQDFVPFKFGNVASFSVQPKPGWPIPMGQMLLGVFRWRVLSSLF